MTSCQTNKLNKCILEKSRVHKDIPRPIYWYADPILCEKQRKNTYTKTDEGLTQNC